MIVQYMLINMIYLLTYDIEHGFHILLFLLLKNEFVGLLIVMSGYLMCFGM